MVIKHCKFQSNFEASSGTYISEAEADPSAWKKKGEGARCYLIFSQTF